jgi:hypothetical protein
MANEIIRRLRDGGVLGETVESWHCESEGPGEPGGRTYHVLYAPNGRIRVDVSGCWSSTYHTVLIEPEEVRPAEEWREHLLATGQTPGRRAYCQHCGLEKPDGLMGSCPEGCRDHQPEW